MTPQTMAVITRTFPAESRGRAMSLWGAVAGVATLVGPILGGVLVDGLGWEWIFFVNVPVGVVGFVLAARLVPELPTHVRRFDLLGRGAERRRHVPAGLRHPGGSDLRLGHDRGPDLGVVADHRRPRRAGGLRRLAGAHHRGSRCCTLSLFRDRNFSLANVAITTVGFARHRDGVPASIFYAQGVLGLSPTQVRAAARADGGDLRRPVAVRRAAAPTGCTRAGSPGSGWPASRSASGLARGDHGRRPRRSGSCCCRSRCSGVANGFVWAPIATTATRNLPPSNAGGGAGVYNTTRQIGAVLGSAGIAALIAVAARREPAGIARRWELGGRRVAAAPEALHAGFATAMAQALVLPAAVLADRAGRGAAVRAAAAPEPPVARRGGGAGPAGCQVARRRVRARPARAGSRRT